MRNEQNIYDKISKEISENHYCLTQLSEIDHKLAELLPEHYTQFSDSWNNLDMDLHMADNGKYRYRRYSVVNWRIDSGLEYLPPEPHFQKKTYNTLNGDVYRHYSPFEDSTLRGPFLKEIISCSTTIFNQLKDKQQDWRIECHQFRIVPSLNESGLPTPEGKHRDGVEYVFMMIVNRYNVEGGVTRIYDNLDQLLSTYTMKNSCECIFIDDGKTMHEVSPIYPSLIEDKSYRDILVLTFQKF